MSIHALNAADRRIESLPKSTVPLDLIQKNISGVVPYFQSFWDVQNNCVEGVETLMRVNLPDGQVLVPYEFLKVAVESGFYMAMQRTLIEKVFATLKDSPLSFSINLFPSDIEQGMLTQEIIDLVEVSQTQGKAVVEILEWEDIDNDRVFRENIEALKSAGVLLALDDFGSRSSDLKRLETYLPFLDKVKFDGTRFIREIDVDQKRKDEFYQAVDNVRSFGVGTIVAERVENAQVYEIIKQAGVDIAQGYHIDKPQAVLPDINRRELEIV